MADNSMLDVFPDDDTRLELMLRREPGGIAIWVNLDGRCVFRVKRLPEGQLDLDGLKIVGPE